MRRVRGFTLIEMVLALGIAAAVLVIVFGGLRAGLGAWSRGEARAAQIDHARGVLVLLERALDGAFPYRFVPADQREPRVLFEGRPDQVLFATLAPHSPAGRRSRSPRSAFPARISGSPSASRCCPIRSS